MTCPTHNIPSGWHGEWALSVVGLNYYSPDKRLMTDTSDGRSAAKSAARLGHDDRSADLSRLNPKGHRRCGSSRKHNSLSLPAVQADGTTAVPFIRDPYRRQLPESSLVD